MRLDKLLANTGYGSRKQVKSILKKGEVTVDGKTEKNGKVHVDPAQQEIVIDGEEVIYDRYLYVMMNKPKGVISATEDPVHQTVVDLLAEGDARFHPFPVGRLDKDTEGLLLLTNDGQLTHRLLSPNKHVPKTYIAQVKGVVTPKDIASFSKGIVLDDGYQTKPATLKILHSGDLSEVEITITEGKFHQIKRMFVAVGKQVIELKRMKMGSLSLDESLLPGEYRKLSEDEIDQLRQNH